MPADSPDFKRVTRSVIWEVVFEDGISAKDYAKQLDYFKIELGAADSQGQVQYAGRVSSTRPDKRSGKIQDDKRITIGWKKGNLLNFDRKLLGKAGINTAGKTILHFYPAQIESQLFNLEQAYAGEDADKIVRTQFKIHDKVSEPGYEFYVAEQQLRPEATGTTSSAKSDSR